MTLPRLEVVSLLKSHQIFLKKSLGQNFLTDPAALNSIIAAAEIPPSAAILEVGPGLGSLTRHLALAARRVVAVELDSRLIPLLHKVLQDFENVTVIEGDILKLPPAELMAEPGYLVVANIPYYITSALIRHLLEAPLKPDRLVLTVQREVAERICAAPGNMSLLALGVQVYGSPRPVARIPAGAFYPSPKIDSTVIRVDLFPEPRIPPAQIDTFFSLAKAGFSQKRKTLRNALSAGLHLSPSDGAALLLRAGIDPQRRAETLTIAEWGALTSCYDKQHSLSVNKSDSGSHDGKQR
jgi:16S rRNA (adenine1518-N6/adenine1519-N6)-dimethyltransferase